MKDDFLEPLKLQGVADIDDNATIMRFKTTVLPIRPSYIQREAIKRLIAAFKEAGIEFSSASFAIHRSAALRRRVPPRRRLYLQQPGQADAALGRKVKPGRAAEARMQANAVI